MAKATKAAAKKSGAKKSAAKKGAAKKSGQSSAKANKNKAQEQEYETDRLARASQENSEHKESVYNEMNLPADYNRNVHEIDPQRSSVIESNVAAQRNRERLQKESESQKVS